MSSPRPSREAIFWNAATRANRLYKAQEFEGACVAYARAFDIMDGVEPAPTAANRATLHYNFARALIQERRTLEAVAQLDRGVALQARVAADRVAVLCGH